MRIFRPARQSIPTIVSLDQTENKPVQLTPIVQQTVEEREGYKAFDKVTLDLIENKAFVSIGTLKDEEVAGATRIEITAHPEYPMMECAICERELTPGAGYGYTEKPSHSVLCLPCKQAYFPSQMEIRP